MWAIVPHKCQKAVCISLLPLFLCIFFLILKDFKCSLQNLEDIQTLRTKENILSELSSSGDCLFYDVYQQQTKNFNSCDLEAVFEFKKQIEDWLSCNSIKTDVILRFKSILSRTMVGLLFLFSRGFRSFRIYGCFSKNSFNNSESPFPDLYVCLEDFISFDLNILKFLSEPISDKNNWDTSQDNSLKENNIILEFISVPKICSDTKFYELIWKANSLSLFHFLIIKIRNQ